jgi:uncharacterized protein YjdB
MTPLRSCLASAVVLLTLSACGGGSSDNGTSCGGIVSPQRTITASPSTVELDVGGQQQLVGSANSGCAGDPPAPVTWSSGGPSVATVSATGLVAANGPGQATITATAFNGTVSASVSVSVRRPVVTSVTASETSLRLRERQLRRLAATVVTTGNLTRRAVFTSRAPAIASVRVIDSVSAEITAVATGSTTIDVAAAGDTLSRITVPVTVDPAIVASIRISGTVATDSLLLGTRRVLTATVRDSAAIELRDRVVRWTSETPGTAPVSSSGELQAIRAGVARVTARVAIGDGSGDRVDTLTTRVFGTLDIAVLPRASTVEEGQTAALQATVTATSGLDRTIDWESSRPAVAQVSSTGVIAGVSIGSAVIRARSRAVASIVDSISVDVVARGIPTAIAIAPRVDTLSPRGTRTLQATVRDQRNAVLSNAPIAWRSLSPALASVSATGLVTALANGTVRIVATTPRVTGVDSLADTSTVLIVNPCTLVRPVALGSTITRRFDASTCAGFVGFDLVEQFEVTTSTQSYYSVSLTPTFRASLIALNVGTAFIGQEAPAGQVTEALVVTRPGTFGFMVSGLAGATGSYTVSSALNPDPRRNCVFTHATFGVSFQTAVSPLCQQRDIQLIPRVSPGQVVRISATAASFPVRIELRNFNTNGVLASAGATAVGGTATITYSSAPDFLPTFIRVFGGPSQTDLVSIVIDR